MPNSKNLAAHKESTRSHYQVTFAVLAMGVGAYALLQSLVTPVLPTIQASLHTSQANVTWVLTAYLLSASIFTPILGRFGDMKGKKRMFVIALIALAIGCVLSALATSLAVMIAGRVIQGIGGGVLPLAFGIIRDEFPSEKVPGAVGVIAALTAVGGGLGIVIAGPIVHTLNYHWLFWIPLILISLGAIGAYVFVPESLVLSPGRINYFTAVLLSIWLVALLVAVSEAPTWGWGSLRVIGLIALAAIVAATWIIAESRSANPLIDMRMMRIRSVWTVNLVTFLFGMSMYSLLAFLPEFTQTPSSAGYGFGASITESGLMLLPSTVTMFVLGIAAGRMAERWGSKNLLITGTAISIAPFLMYALMHDHTIEIYAASALYGLGFGMAFAAMSNLIVAAVPPDQTGVASGMNANIRTIGGSIGAAVMASVVTAHLQPSGLPRESGYTSGFLMLTAFIVACLCATVFVPAVRRSPENNEEPHVELRHAELANVAGGTLVGDESE